MRFPAKNSLLSLTPRVHADYFQLPGKSVRTDVRYVITKFSGMDGLPNFLTHGAPLRAFRVRESSAISQLVRQKGDDKVVTNFFWGNKRALIDCVFPARGLLLIV